MVSISVIIGVLLYVLAILIVYQSGVMVARNRYLIALLMLVLGSVIAGLGNNFTGVGHVAFWLPAVIGAVIGGGGAVLGINLERRCQKAASQAEEDRLAAERRASATADGEDEII